MEGCPSSDAGNAYNPNNGLRYGAVIKALRAQAEAIDRAIARLESLNSPDGAQPAKRRGRKFMGPDERKQVAERMKRYWAARRKGKQ